MYGSYVSGEINLKKAEKLYIYIGEEGKRKSLNRTFNGGGASSIGTYGTQGDLYYQNYSGAGATDIRLVNGSWNDIKSLRSRIIIAGGSGSGSQGGGLSSFDSYHTSSNCISGGSSYYSYGAKQTSGGFGSKGGLSGSFGIGGDGETSAIYYGSTGGGGGYYGGGGGYYSSWTLNHERCEAGHASGGSSYISGHTGCVGITSENDTTPKNGCTTGTTDNNCSIHYSGKVFTNTIMIDGDGYNWTNEKGTRTLIPNPAGGYFEEEQGLEGNGYTKITLIN